MLMSGVKNISVDTKFAE